MLDVPRTLGVHRRGRGDPAFRVAADGSIWRTSLTPDGPATARAGAGGPTPASRSACPPARTAGVPSRTPARPRRERRSGAPGRPGSRGGVGAGRVLAAGTRCPPRSARTTTGPASTRRIRCCASCPAGIQGVRDRPVRAGAGGAGARGAGAEGGRRRGPPGLALPAAPVRRARARAGPGRACGCRRAAATLAADPVLGVAPGRRGGGPRPAPSSARPRWPARLEEIAAMSAGGRRPAAAVAARRSGRGPPPRSASGPAATPDAVSRRRLPPARAGSAGRWPGGWWTTPGMLELLAPYPGHRYRAARLVELSGLGPPRRGPRHADARLPGVLSSTSARDAPQRPA